MLHAVVYVLEVYVLDLYSTGAMVFFWIFGLGFSVFFLHNLQKNK